MSTTTIQPEAPLALVPESAPFSEEQRAWLNGFFAGMLGGVMAGGAGASASPAAPAVSAAVEKEEETPWHDPALALADRLKLAEGKRHPLKLMSAMAQLDCGSCGYLCKTYAEAIAAGKEKDLTRCTPGGRDTAKMLKQLQANAPTATPAEPVKTKKGTGTAQAGSYDRTHPFSARLLRNESLNGPASAKNTRLIVIDLRGSGISYKPGDALGIYPENCPLHVEQILQSLHFTGAEDVMGWDDQTASFREALTKDFTITRPSPDLLDLLARCATVESERADLSKLRDSDEGSGDLTILDLLTRFPSVRLSPGDFVATLSPLAPRLYSISSSLRAHPDQVHLTVGTVQYQNSAGRSCKGVASTFLAERLRPGQRIRVFVQPSHRFALADGEKPIIMVGPGTGIAPFRAFLQDRRATGATGKSWLIFGDQKSDGDFLYRNELENYLAEGTLTRLDTAFSRDQTEKVYVQHRLIENAAEVWHWLNQGAHFYVCGDAQRMANDVDKALRRIISQAGGLSPEETDRFVSELTREGRYQRDVY